jgi:UDP-glucose:(heptosyl)LPS alpha-1,3-glucosyltransferase
VRVGAFVDRLDPARGGMERALCQLITHLRGRGHEVNVYGMSAADTAPGDFRLVQVPRLPRGGLERVLAQRSLAAARGDGCDVTLAVRHAAEVDVLWPHGGAHGATLAAGERAKGGVAGSVSKLLHRASPRHRAFLDLERAALTGGVGRVWCVSELVRAELSAAYPGCEERLEVHANGVDRETFHPRLREQHRDAVRAEHGVAAGAPLLVFPGGNLRLKGWPLLLEALTAATDAAWTCLAVGCDVGEASRDALAAGLEQRVRVLPRQDMTRMLGAADLLVQPTYRDPCSLATLEALAGGVPVVTTQANGASEALGGPDAGTVVPVGDAAALGAALRTWIARLAGEAERAAAGVAARAATDGRNAEAWLDALTASLEACAT